MIKKIEKISFAALLFAVFTVTALIFGAKGCLGYYKENSARRNGSLSTLALQRQDFQLCSLVEKDGGLRATDGDPQMHFELNGVFTGIAIKADYAVYPGDIILYYTEVRGADYSSAKMIYVSQDKEDPQLYTGRLPATQVASIRLDPTTIAGNLIDIDSVVINPPLSLADYLSVTPYHLLMWVVYSLLLAAILRFVQEFFTKNFE